MSVKTYRHFIVTGGSGYLGEALVDMILSKGLRVSLLSTGPKQRKGVRHFPWRLGEPLPREALDSEIPLDEQALIHLAYDWSDTDPDAGINLIGTHALRDSARNSGLGRSVFISSQSARADALNAYGRIKSRMEQLFDSKNEVSLRVGLVYGGPRKGQYGILCKLAAMTSIIPMVRPNQLVQPIHRTEVARGIILAANSTAVGSLGLASPFPIPFSQFLNDLAWRLRGGRLRLISVPLGAALSLCAIINKLPFMPHVDRERILGIAGTRTISTQDDLDRICLEILPFAIGMLNEPAARRALLREGRTLLRYVLGEFPDSALLRLYWRAATAEGPEGAIHLPYVFHLAPYLLRFFEPMGAGGELAHRLKIATAVAAASPQAARSLESGGRISRLMWLGSSLLLEVIAIPTRLIATKMRL